MSNRYADRDRAGGIPSVRRVKLRYNPRRRFEAGIRLYQRRFENGSRTRDLEPETYLVGIKNKLETDKSASSIVSTDFLDRDIQNFLIEEMDAGHNVFCLAGSRLCPPKFHFEDWIHSNFNNYSMDKGPRGIAYKVVEGKLLRFFFSMSRNNLAYEIHGPRKEVKNFITWLDNEGFSQEETSIIWAFGKDYQTMERFELPLQIPKSLVGAYPWLNGSISEFTEEFMDSKASILILIGPPGTGKTTFIKEMIQSAKTGAMVTYDTDLLFTDGFFAAFMTAESSNFLILEDADSVMGSRKDGNTMMHKFLNASDGLVSLQRKKIIFTTNLPSIKDVDPALLRKGRCFDVIHPRKLTKAEAYVVAKQLYGNDVVLNQDYYTLAEVTNLTARSITAKDKVGF